MGAMDGLKHKMERIYVNGIVNFVKVCFKVMILTV